MSNFVVDSFTDTNGTLLSAHTGATGASWTKLYGTGTAPVIESNQLEPNAAGDQQSWYASGTPPTADYSVSFAWTQGNNTGPVIAVCVRLADGGSAETCYRASFQNGQGWAIYKHLNGVQTVIGNKAATPVNGTTYNMVFSVVGTSLSLSVNGVVQVTATDSSISAKGKVGVLVYAGTDGSLGISGLTAGPAQIASGTLTASIASSTSVALSVGSASQGVSPYNYQFQCAPDSSGSPGSFSNVGSNSTSTTYTDTGLTTRTPYWYQCVATDADSNTVTSNQVRIIPGTATTFYIDEALGNDTNAGTGAGASAWQTLSHASSVNFVPGDSLLLTSGQTFNGTLTISNSGSFGNPITVATTGSGSATINTSTAANNGLVLQDCQYVSVSNLTLTGPGVSSSGTHASTGIGIYINSTATATGETYYQGIRVSKITISGFATGLLCYVTNGTPTVGASNVSGVGVGYADLRINNVTVSNGGNHGIRIDNNVSYGMSDWYQCFFCKGVYVGNCNVSNVYGNAGISWTETGSGIRGGGLKASLIENCVVQDCGGKNGSSTAGGPVGIYIFLCDTVTIRNCQVARQGTASPSDDDGDAYDMDGGTTNCLIESCVGRDCVGNGMLNYVWGGLPNSGNIYRNCISVNNAANGAHQGPILRATAACRFENCTIYSDATTIGYDATLVGGDSGAASEGSGTVLTNCVFILLNGSTASIAGTTTLQNNLYWFGSTGGFDVTYNGTSYTTLPTLQAVAETVYGSATGYNQNPGLPAPVANQSCAQLLAAWNAAISGILVTGGITPQTMGSGTV